jgi:hypothetical protein
MALAGREKLLGALQRRYLEADVPGFGGVRIQSLSAAQAEDLNIGNQTDGKFDPEKYKTYKVRVIVLCMVDEHNMRIFSDSDVEILHEQDATIIDGIYEACEQHLNGDVVTPKNLNGTSEDDSQSDLQINSESAA